MSGTRVTVTTVDTPGGGVVRLRVDGLRSEIKRLRIIVEEGGHSGVSASVELSRVNVHSLVAALQFFGEEVGS
jgi:hypothetical protein